MTLRIVFAGTPDFAVPCLDAVADSGHELVGVLTQPDRPAGRGRRLAASPVKQRALALGAPVQQPERLKPKAAFNALAALEPDLIVVVAYGLLLPPKVLALPRLGCVNVHASLLPRWRGAAPIARALLAGDRESGITLMRMARGLDTGPMLVRRAEPIGPEDTAATLHDRLAELGAAELARLLADPEALASGGEPQQEAEACYAGRLSKAEAAIDWQHSAAAIARAVRAFSPWPVAYAQLDGQPLRLWQASAIDRPASAAPGTIEAAHAEGLEIATGDGLLRLERLQLPGKRQMSAAEALHGRDWVGLRLG